MYTRVATVIDWIKTIAQGARSSLGCPKKPVKSKINISFTQSINKILHNFQTVTVTMMTIVMVKKFVSTVSASGQVKCLKKSYVAQMIELIMNLFDIYCDVQLLLFPGCNCETDSDCGDPDIDDEIALASKHKKCKICRCVPMGTGFCLLKHKMMHLQSTMI